MVFTNDNGRDTVAAQNRSPKTIGGGAAAKRGTDQH